MRRRAASLTGGEDGDASGRAARSGQASKSRRADGALPAIRTTMFDLIRRPNGSARAARRD
jgi:hypothetical protein